MSKTRNKTEKYEQWSEIRTGYDRRSGCYIAYSTETGIVATGNSIPTAIEGYRANFYEKQELLKQGEFYASQGGDLM